MNTPLLSALTFALLPIAATAATKTWDGQGAFERWDSGINWVGNNAPNSNDDLLWNSNGVLGYETDNDFPAGTQFRSLTFTSVDHGAVNGWVHNGNRVHLTHGINYYGDTTYLGLPIRLTGDQTWTNGASNAHLWMENNATLDINGRTLTLEGDLELADARLIGAGVIHILNDGYLALDQPANSFTGTVNVDKTLALLYDATLTGSAQVNLSPGAGLGCWPSAGVSPTHTVHVNMAAGSALGEEATIDCVMAQAADVVTLAGTVTCTGARNEAEVFNGTLALQSLTGAGNFDVTLYQGAGVRTQGASGVAPITGSVIVRLGPLQMGRTAQPSFNGPLQLLGGSIAWQANNQFGSLGSLSITSGTGDMAGHTDTVRSLTLDRGTLTMNGGALSIREQLTVNMPTAAIGDRSVITGNLSFLLNDSEISVTQDAAATVPGLTLTGNVSVTGPPGARRIAKDGGGRLAWTGIGSLDILHVSLGELIYEGSSPAMNVLLGDAEFQAKGTVRDIEGLAGPSGALRLPDDGTLTARNLALTSFNTFAGVRPGILNHPMLIATGTVALGNAVLAPTFPPGAAALALQGVIGEETVLIQKNSAGAVSGTFVDSAGAPLAEGALISIPARTWRLSYAGGDGNDVSLTLVSVTASGLTHSYTPPNAGSHQWTNNAVWTPAGPLLPGAALTFASAANFIPVNNLPANTAMQSLSFTFPGHNVSGNALALRAGIWTTHSTGTTIVRTPLQLTGAIQDFRASGGGVLQIGELTSGSVDLNGSILGVYPEHSNSTVRVGDGGSANPMITGTGWVRITGAGTAIFGRASTYTGLTTVESGTLRLEQHGSALGVSGAGNHTDVYNAGILELANLGGSPVTDKILLAGGLRADAGGGSCSLSGELVLNGPARPIEVASGTLVFGSTISGSGFTKSGPGTLYISGNTHTFAGPMVSNAGTVRILSNANRWPGDVDILGGSLSLEGNENLTGDLLLGPGTSMDVSNGPQLLNAVQLNNCTVQTGANQFSALFINAGGNGLTTWTGALHVRTASSLLRVNDTPAAAEDLLVNGALTGAAGAELQVEGTGRVKFTGNNTLPVIELCDAVSVFTGNSPGMAVKLCGGNMAGTGTVGNITSLAGGGRVDPGLSAGILSSGNIAWNAATIFAPELATGAPGTNYDQLIVTGTVNLGGAALLVIPSGSPAGVFTVIQNDSSDAITGTFAGLPENSVVSNLGKSFRISYLGGTGNDVTLTAIITGTGVTRVWDGGDTLNANWNDPDNWVDLTPGVPSAPVAGDDLVFPAVAADKFNTNNFAAGTTFNSLRIESSDYSLNGTALSLNAGLVWDYASGLSTVNLAVTLAQPQTFSVLQGAHGAISGLGSLNNAGLAFTADVAAAGQLTLFGINGTGGITKNGAGRLTLGSNTYTGATVLNAGLTSTSVTGGFGSAATAIAVNAAATLQFDSVVGTFTRPLTLGGKLIFLNTAMTASGAITLSGAARQIEVTGVTPSLTGILSGSGGLQKTGTGTLTLSGSTGNTFTGGGTVAAGTLRLAKSSSQVALPGPVTIGDGAGTDILLYAAANQISNAATVNLLGSGAQFQCSTFSDTIGALRLTGGSVSGSGTLTVGETIQSFAAATTASVDVNLVPSVSPFSLIVEDGTAAPDLSINGEWNGSAALAVERAGPGTLVLAGNGTAATLALSEGLTRIERDWSGVAISLSGGSLGGTGPVGDVTTVAGKDGFILPGASTDILAVSKWIGDSNTVLTMEIGGLTPGTGHDVLNVRSLADPQLATLVLQLLPGFTLMPGQSFTIITNDDSDQMPSEFRDLPQGGRFDFGGTTAEINYRGGDGNDVTITVLHINDTGTVRVWDGDGADANWMTPANWVDDVLPQPGDRLVFPSGTPRPSAANNFPADTSFTTITLSKGVVLSGSRVLLRESLAFTDAPSGGNVHLNIPLRLMGTVTVSASLTGAATVILNGPVDNNGQVLIFDTASTINVNSGAVISGSGAVIKRGAAAVGMHAAHTYTGATTVQSGVILAGHTAAFGSAAGNTVVNAGAHLALSVPGTFTEPVRLAGRLVTGGVGTVTLTGSLTLTNALAEVDVDVGDTLIVAGAMTGAPATAGLNKISAGTLRITSSTANTVLNGGIILQQGTLELAKTTGVITAPFTFPGPTGLPAVLRLGASHQIADTSTVTMSRTTAAFDLAGFSDTVASLSMTGGSVTTGAGTLTLTGGLTTLSTFITATLSGNLAHTGAGTHTWSIANGTASPDLHCDAVVTTPAGVIVRKTGAGSASFTSACAMSEFQIAAGQVNWNGNGFATAISMDGGTLTGTGTASRINSLAGGGIVSPGTSPGTLFAAFVNWNAATTFRVEVNGTAPGTEYDVLALEDNTSLGGATLDFHLGYTPAPGDSYTILTTAGSLLTNTFAGLPEGAFFVRGGNYFRITYTGGAGSDVVITRLDPAAPEIVSYTRTPGTGPNAGSDVVDFELQGYALQNYLLEVSDDLVTWTTLITEPSDAGGQIAFHFLEPQTLLRRYYRARLE